MKEPEAHDESRRDFVKKAAWVAPIVLSLAATPAKARAASFTPAPYDQH
jgi:hypothetical protein